MAIKFFDINVVFVITITFIEVLRNELLKCKHSIIQLQSSFRSVIFYFIRLKVLYVVLSPAIISSRFLIKSKQRLKKKQLNINIRLKVDDAYESE